MISSERVSQEEQNGANFSFIVSCSEELGVFKVRSAAVATFTICVFEWHQYVHVTPHWKVLRS